MEKEDVEKLINLFKKRDNLKKDINTIDRELTHIIDTHYFNNIILANESINISVSAVSTEYNITLLKSIKDIINKKYIEICNLCDSYILSKKVE